jgi:hypothetical protein
MGESMGMNSPESIESNGGMEKIVDEIKGRLAQCTSPRVHEKVAGMLQNLGDLREDTDIKMATHWSQRGDYSDAARNPSDQQIKQYYPDWEPEELQQLYEVLYGEKV